MNLLRKPGAIAVAALALAALPSVAAAHDGNHPFENCTEAYANGYANIRAGDEHYGSHLDRDKDGIGCDKPPADFVPAEDQGAGSGAGDGTTSDDGTSDEATSDEATSGDGTGQDGTDLAATGGDDSTPYIAAGGAAALLAGGGVLLAVRRRRAPR
ncbi:excalibur calcium-binding domain-containing protein [Streptomyces ferrugineus]|uniref:excalibur calcium-binding domain-containing protein n=1 Tax=Streptomyces ferrugineus TaxID=1413221 RepID=UPI001D141059|nr:excalibur calcium-binding domain-containing protein [Streptomyces ferrugineus]